MNEKNTGQADLIPAPEDYGELRAAVEQLESADMYLSARIVRALAELFGWDGKAVTRSQLLEAVSKALAAE